MSIILSGLLCERPVWPEACTLQPRRDRRVRRSPGWIRTRGAWSGTGLIGSAVGSSRPWAPTP